MTIWSGRNMIFTATMAGFLASTPANADVNTDANALFVGAVQAWTAAVALPADAMADRAALLQTVNRNLDQIITDLPGSDLAVRLITGETLGPITLQGARDALAQADAAIPMQDCAAMPTPGCLLQVAVAELGDVEDYDLKLILPRLISGLADADDTATALALFDRYPDSDGYTRQAYVARFYARTDQTNLALDIVAATAVPAEQSYIRAAIVQGLMDRGADTDALSVLSQVTDPADKVLGLIAMQAFDEAFAQIDQVPADGQNWVRNQLAIAAAQADQVDRAQMVLDQIDDSDWRKSPIQEIAMAQARAGLVAEAIETAHRIPDPARLKIILALWHIAPDPAYVAEIQDRFDRTSAQSVSRRHILFIMNLVDPRPDYLAELQVLDAAVEERSLGRMAYADIELLNAAGRYADAATLALAMSTNDGRAWDKVSALMFIAEAISADPQQP